MKTSFRSSAALLALLLCAGLLFHGLYRYDNKYTAALPGGAGFNVLQGNGSEAAFLVDGWEYYPGELLSPEDFQRGRTPAAHTYAGEHPNLSENTGSPYGAVTYRLILRNPGAPVTLSLWLPEPLCAARVCLGGELAGETGGVSPYRPLVRDGVYAFRAGAETEIIVQCANYTHYYTGMYYPPAVGAPDAIARLLIARTVIYGFLCFVPLAAAVAHLALWLTDRRRSRLALWMGFLCMAYALRMCYPFLRMLGTPFVRPLYALEDVCGNAVLLFAILMAGELSGQADSRLHRRLALPAAAGLCAVSGVFPLFILPYIPAFINIYGVILFLWKFLAGLYLLFLALRGLRTRADLGGWLLPAAGLYGAALALSVLSVNRFEPIRGAWPEEYGGFMLVALFVAMMVRRSMDLTAENQRLTGHLQEEVALQTGALNQLLAERRRLLADIVHDVKTPLTAVRNYTELIRSGGVGLDEETVASLDALAGRVRSMEERFGDLQEFSRNERGGFHPAQIDLAGLLRAFYEDNRPDVELSGQELRLELPQERMTVSGDPARLRRALENLCYNAVSFTPAEGVITLSLAREGGTAVLSVADTGSGIDPEDLPRVFDRGFSRRTEDGGEGLGLFIVRMIALEHGGTAEAASQPGKGSVFTLRLPLT